MGSGKLLRLFLGVILCLFIAQIFGAPPAQAKEKWVSWLSNSDYTGPVAGMVSVVDKGQEDYFKYINEQGGINGVKIKFIGIDTRSDVSRLISTYKRYRKSPKLLASGVWSTGAAKILAAYQKRDHLIQLTPGDGEFQAHQGRTFLMCPPYQNGYAAAIDWMIKDWKSKGKSGMPTVGEMHFDNAFGKERLRGGKEYAEKMGVKLLKPEYFKMGTIRYDVYLKRLADAGANYIHLGAGDPVPINVLRDAYRLGLTKKIQFSCDYFGVTIGGVESHPGPAEGAVVICPFLRGEEAINNPLVKKLWTKYNGPMSTFKNGGYSLGVATGINFSNALKVALDRVGYKKITGDDIYRAYQEIGGNDPKGMMGPCTYGPNSRAPAKVVKIYQVKNSKIVPVTGWFPTPDAVSLFKF